jgi:hypothetical protein
VNYIVTQINCCAVLNGEVSNNNLLIIEVKVQCNVRILGRLYICIQGDSRSPFVGSFLISQNRVNVKVGSRL